VIAASVIGLFWLQIPPLDRLVNLYRGRGGPQFGRCLRRITGPVGGSEYSFWREIGREAVLCPYLEVEAPFRMYALTQYT